jgi:hypothetical protein
VRLTSEAPLFHVNFGRELSSIISFCVVERRICGGNVAEHGIARVFDSVKFVRWNMHEFSGADRLRFFAHAHDALACDDNIHLGFRVIVRRLFAARCNIDPCDRKCIVGHIASRKQTDGRQSRPFAPRRINDRTCKHTHAIVVTSFQASCLKSGHCYECAREESPRIPCLSNPLP